MPKKERAPQLRGIAAADFKNRERLIKRLIDQRLGFGKSVLYDTDNHQPRYPLDIIGKVLLKAEKKAIAIGRHLDLSFEEKKLIEQIYKVITIALGMWAVCFYTDLDGDGIPDFFEFLHRLMTSSTF